jgi:hypothetical protein
LSENESVVNAASGGPEKKLVFVRSWVGSEHLNKRHTTCESCVLSRNCNRSATASRSFSSSRGSYDWDLPDLTGKGGRCQPYVSRVCEKCRGKLTARLAAACNISHV